MKRKIFSIFFALVLVLSLSLVTAVPVVAAPVTQTVTGDGAWGFTLAEMDQQFSTATVDASAGDTVLSGSVTLGIGASNDDVWYEAGLVSNATYLGYSRLHNKGYYMLAFKRSAHSFYTVFMQNVPTVDASQTGNYLGDESGYVDLWGDAGLCYFRVPNATFDYQIKYHNVTTTGGNVDLRISVDGGTTWSGWKLYKYAETDVVDYGLLTAEQAITYGYAGDDDLTDARIVSQIFVCSGTTETFTADYDNIEVNGTSYALAPRVLNVDTGKGYTAIQLAIDAPETDAGDTISVAAGTYDEQVEIITSLTLQGAGDDTIIQPSGPGLVATTSIPWIGGGTGTMAAIVSVETTGAEVTIRDLEIDGSLITTKSTTWVGGLVYLETSGTVEGVTVIGNSTLPDRTAGIFAAAITESASLEVTGCTVIGYNRAGIYALGGEFTADYHHNEINGPGPLSTGVPNGMFFLEGATGSATYNTITDLGYTGEEYRSTGIGTYNAGEGIVFSHNEISNVQNAFALAKNTEGTIVEYNTVYECHTGVRLESGTKDNIIRYNSIEGNTYAIRCGGVGNGTMGVGNVAHFNDFVGNAGTGMEGYEGAVCVQTGGTVTLDATNNWWGKATGPYHATTNPGVVVNMGNAVSDNVLFSPWLYKTKAIVPTKEPAYAQSVVLDNFGAFAWNTFSTPIVLDDTADTWAKLITLTSLNYDIAYRFDLATQEFVNLETGDDYAITPGEGFFIKMNTAGSLPILYSTAENLVPPSRALTEGWNLLGLASLEDMLVENALFSLAGEGQVVSPTGNVEPGAVLADDTVYVGEAYWAYMLSEETLVGFTTTPVNWVP